MFEIEKGNPSNNHELREEEVGQEQTQYEIEFRICFMKHALMFFVQVCLISLLT